MEKVDTAKLRELAEKADDTHFDWSTATADDLRARDRAHEAFSNAAHPAAVLALLDENARLRGALQHAEAAMDSLADHSGLSATETARLWNATRNSISAALSGGAA